MNKRKISIYLLGFSLFLVAAGCKKKAPPPPPPPPPPPAKPAPPPPKVVISEFTAEPSTIERGQSSTLRWVVRNATDISISPSIGAVQAEGNRRVFPSETTTYMLNAKGPGGSDQRNVTVTVTVPPPPPPPPPPKPKVTVSELLERNVRDAYFDFDKSDIRPDAQVALTHDAQALKEIFSEFPNAQVTIGGYCDERGSAEYNLALGDRRATSAKEFLVQLGVPASKLNTISYGKERPQCTEHTEECWQLNRRVHFVESQ
jgi:peptidoglycan-associated lipoprotein